MTLIKNELTPKLPFAWGELSFGPAQRTGALSMLPLLGSGSEHRLSPPLSGLKLSRVKGYGNVELENRPGFGTAIVPLHIGYIQDQAQNHALCRSAFLGEGQKLMFKDACCVQASQGGYLEGRDQWFFILPLELRERALALRGKEAYGKLWNDISKLNTAFGLASRGHLDQIVCRQRATLTQYAGRFEKLDNQVGALFFLKGRLAGIELTPNEVYFEELWMPLVCFCYGASAMLLERDDKTLLEPSLPPLEGRSLVELRRSLEASRVSLQEELLGALAGVPEQSFSMREEERFVDLRLSTVEGQDFAGQIVQGPEGELVYASMFARPAYLV